MSPNTKASLMMIDEPTNEIRSESSSWTSSSSIENNSTENHSVSNNSRKSKSNTVNVIQLNRKRPSRKRKVLLKIRSKMEDPKVKACGKQRQNQRDAPSSPSYSDVIDARSSIENNKRNNTIDNNTSHLQKNYSNSSFISASNYSPTPTKPTLGGMAFSNDHSNYHISATPSPSPAFNHSQKQFVNSFNNPTPNLNNSINQSPNGYHSYIHHHNSIQQPRVQQPVRRCMELRLIEEGMKTLFSNFFSTFRRRTQSVDTNYSSPTLNMPPSSMKKVEMDKFDIIRVSWYDGTTTAELQDYVRCAITRKIGKAIMDYRILDLDSDEEIVLSPYIPDGSKFLVRYSFPPPVKTIYDYSSTAPYSPSRALTPVNSETELEKLPDLDIGPPASATEHPAASTTVCTSTTTNTDVDPSSQVTQEIGNSQDKLCKVTPAGDSRRSLTEGSSGMVGAMTPEMRANTDPVTVVVKVNTPMQQLKYVIWVIAKSFISFLTIVRICAELYERSPAWKEQIIGHLENVEACAVDRDSLFECVSRGDFSGLMASFVIWITSKTTRQFFLFGFDSVQTLYHCVYEAFVSSFCWGCSYMFIRRGLNPDTRTNCLLKYWKDCAYGTLANFFQNFIKTVLKNLIPKEAVKEAFDEALRASTAEHKFGFLGLGIFKKIGKVNAEDIILE